MAVSSKNTKSWEKKWTAHKSLFFNLVYLVNHIVHTQKYILDWERGWNPRCFDFEICTFIMDLVKMMSVKNCIIKSLFVDCWQRQIWTTEHFCNYYNRRKMCHQLFCLHTAITHQYLWWKHTLTKNKINT